jgi:hypothetical protein
MNRRYPNWNERSERRPLAERIHIALYPYQQEHDDKGREHSPATAMASATPTAGVLVQRTHTDALCRAYSSPNALTRPAPVIT